MSQSMIAKCPDCNHEFLYKGHAIRPRVHCPKCKKRFYITTQTTHRESEIPKSNNKPYSSQKEGGADPPSNRGSFIKIDDDTIEICMLQMANEGDISVPLIKAMIEFYYKIRGSTDKVKDEIDMEAFKAIGTALKDSD